jgi:hypothetical protein
MSKSDIIDKNNKCEFYCVGEKTYHKIEIDDVCLSTAKNKRNGTTTYLVKATCPVKEYTICKIISEADFDMLKKKYLVKKCSTY